MKEKLIDNAVGAETALTELKGRLLQLSNTLGQTDLGTFAYGYDNPLLGQRTSMTSALGTTSYTYDSNYQLTGATYPNTAPFNGEVHSWTYDNIGNRLTNTVNSTTANYTYFKNGSNPLNGQRLQSDGTKTYTYDANGNVTGDGTYTYTWDYENRLTGVSGGGVTATYSYDYLGRRKSKTISGVTTSYLYDDRNMITETSTTTADYLFGPDLDQPLAVSRGGVASYYNVDSLGSIASLSDLSGVIQNSYDYDAWGVLRNQTGSIQNPFLYTARESAEAGLFFYRHRYYNSSLGRFISEDPLRDRSILFAVPPEVSARFDIYYYVKNHPTEFIDPLGLAHRYPPEKPRTVPKLIFIGWCPYSKSSIAGDTSTCRDGGGSGMLHPGQTCFRRMGGSGMHICFNKDDSCDIHFDFTPPCTKRNADGSCNFVGCLGGPGIRHIISDVMSTSETKVCFPKPKDCCPGQQ